MQCVEMLVILDTDGSSCYSSHNVIRPRKADEGKKIVHTVLYEYSDDVKLQIKECQLML